MWGFFYVKKKLYWHFMLHVKYGCKKNLSNLEVFFPQKIMFSLITYVVNNKSNDVLCLLLLLLTYKNLVKSDKYCAPYIGTVLFLRTK